MNRLVLTLGVVMLYNLVDHNFFITERLSVLLVGGLTKCLIFLQSLGILI